MTRTSIFLWLGYAAFLAAAITSIMVARQRVEQALTTPEAQAEWEAWRAETVKQSQPGGPVVRRPAKALEPPLLILLRDHFAAAVSSTVVAVTLFYWLFVLLIRGSIRTPAPGPAVEEAEAAR